jgi:site-specific DNA-methyltransferase (adenine-specific)
MPEIADKSIDMVLADLPYGVTACKWDSVIPLEPLWEQYKRIIKDNGAIVLTATQPFASKLVMSNLKMFKYEWIWVKNKGSNFALANKMPLREHENILVFYKLPPIYNAIKQERAETGKIRVKTPVNPSTIGRNYNIRLQEEKKYGELRLPSSVLKFNCETGFHPTQKPVALFEYLIKTYTNPGDLVLDNCAGSGTTGVACKKLNRRCIMIEKEKKYCDIAIERLKNTMRPLF